MSFWDDLGTLIQAVIAQAKLPPANTSGLQKAIADFTALVSTNMEGTPLMTQPTGNVQIAQADLDNFAAQFEAIKTTLAAYIQQLLNNQSTPLPPADESGLQQALTDLDALAPPAPPSP